MIDGVQFFYVHPRPRHDALPKELLNYFCYNLRDACVGLGELHCQPGQVAERGIEHHPRDLGGQHGRVKD